MKKLLALVVVALSSVTLHAQGVWTEENVDPNTGLRTGVIEVNGGTYTIGPNANFFNANLRGADLSRADLRRASFLFSFLDGANLSGANLTESTNEGASFIGANLSGADLRDASFSVSNFRDADLSRAIILGADFSDALLIDNTFDTPDPRIAELEAQLAAVAAERDAAISERDARPTLEEVQDARVGSLVFRADEGANLLDLRFFIQSSENLQDWEITGECNFLLPMDTGKRFLRIALR